MIQLQHHPAPPFPPTDELIEPAGAALSSSTKSIGRSGPPSFECGQAKFAPAGNWRVAQRGRFHSQRLQNPFGNVLLPCFSRRRRNNLARGDVQQIVHTRTCSETLRPAS